jgi:uracil-DNA glycosylase
MINMSNKLLCACKPCLDVNTENTTIPFTDIDPDKVKIIMIAEAPPIDTNDYFYSEGTPFYMQTTIQAFKDAGFEVESMSDILDLGIYITTAVKCSKTQYAINTNTIIECSYLLEKEISYFNNVEVYLLMGDVAIKSMNYIWKRQTGKKIIPSGSTYKIRVESYYIDNKRVFPSYLLTGGNYLIEKTKRIMIAQDIKKAVEVMNS